ncbi:hypothetical protein D3C84_816030 [compost metagenome]
MLLKQTLCLAASACRLVMPGITSYSMRWRPLPAMASTMRRVLSYSAGSPQTRKAPVSPSVICSPIIHSNTACLSWLRSTTLPG